MKKAKFDGLHTLLVVANLKQSALKVALRRRHLQLFLGKLKLETSSDLSFV